MPRNDVKVRYFIGADRGSGRRGTLALATGKPSKENIQGGADELLENFACHTHAAEWLQSHFPERFSQ